jgi:hypothetical protein
VPATSVKPFRAIVDIRIRRPIKAGSPTQYSSTPVTATVDLQGGGKVDPRPAYLPLPVKGGPEKDGEVRGGGGSEGRTPAARQGRRAVGEDRTLKHTQKPGSRSKRIAGKIAEPSDWRGEALSRIRRLITEADPDVVEEVKWRKPMNPAGVPVWSHDGIICTGETYKDHVRLTFADRAALKDPSGLFNANLRGVTRAIVIHEGDKIEGDAFKSLIRAAAMQNASTARD